LPSYKFNNSDYDYHFNTLNTLPMLQRIGNSSIESFCLWFHDPEKTIVFIHWHSGETWLLRFWKHPSKCVSFSDFCKYIIYIHVCNATMYETVTLYSGFVFYMPFIIVYYECCIIFNNYYYYLIPYIHVIWYLLLFSELLKSVHDVEMLTSQ